MPPFVIPPLVKFTLGVLGGAVVIHWAIKEVRRFNAELERVKAASAIDRPRFRPCGAIRKPTSGGRAGG